MNWTELTAPDFKKAVKKCKKTCVIPLGCIEKHGEHLPVGADMFQISALAKKAAQLEEVMVFPDYYFTQISEAKHQPGTIAINDRLMFDLLENTCDEIHRNGFDKVILLNGHGGNGHFLHYFTQIITHQRKKEYSVYYCRISDYSGNMPKYNKLRESEHDGHGGEIETSIIMELYPKLVKMNDLPKNPKAGLPKKRLKGLPAYSGIWWYADYPGHYCGEAKYGTPEKGKVIMEETAKNTAAIIKAIKNDKTVQRLQKEFHDKCNHSDKA